MIKKELLELKQHTRIKYIGANPEVIKQIKERGPKSYEEKGLVFLYASDYTTHSYSDYQKRGIVIRTWSTQFEQVDPADWAVLDARRTDLTRQRERRKVKYADRDVRRTLDSFTEVFQSMKDSKKRIDMYLQDIPLADKLKILTTLTPEQKAWFDLMALDSAVVIEEVKKLVDRLNEGEEQCSSAPAAAV